MKYNNFEGYWKNNLKEGKGNLKSKNEDEYIGLWKDDILIEGKVKYKNGDFYKGNLYQKNKNGIGILKYNNGDIYEGYWINDKKEGNGIMKYKNGDKYEGYWKDDKKMEKE